ncbi:hypothetical protein N657DRAFT_169978 [Parathielavia appendiculata]|uniref:Uncharacterized protein n=1 Tax=Parathielavia appendiculata TaxID=2587402 RepID=A0AAN6TTH6_9PEZI|nr:hypothetical protein N657DRAFT_169978 [Parathielavia appendiculata]
MSRLREVDWRPARSSPCRPRRILLVVLDMRAQTTDPVTGMTERAVFADLDPSRAVATWGFMDVVDHYSRPDLLWLGVDNGRGKSSPIQVGG